MLEMAEIRFGRCTILLLLIRSLLVLATNSQQNENVCRTPECIKISQNILSEMDTEADPCEDMYQYACGGWLKKVNHNADSKTDEVSEEIVRLSLKSLKEGNLTIKGKFSNAWFKAQAFFKNCMDLKTIDEIGPKPLIKLINQLGSWTVVESDDLEPWVTSEWDFKQTIAKVHKAVPDASTFWKFAFESNSKNDNKILFTLTQSPLTLSFKQGYASEKIELHRKIYLEYASGVGELLGGCREDILVKMRQVFALEQRLAEIKDDDTGSPDLQKFKYTTLGDLQSLFGDLIDWEDHLSKVYSRKILNSSDPVVITTPGYFEKIADVIRETDKEVLANFMIWSVVNRVINFLPESFRKAQSELIKVSSGQLTQTSREDMCSKQTLHYFGLAKSAILIDRYYTTNTTDAVHSMLDQIQHEFINNLNTISWLDAETRSKVKEKAEAMKMFVGYPESLRSVEYVDNYYRDLDVKPGQYFDGFLQQMAYSLKHNSDKYGKDADPDEWPESPDKTKAYSVNWLNAVFLPAGFLRYPLFSMLYPKPYYYGGIGSIGAHEIMHGFVDQGIKYTKTGALTGQWWTNASLVAFNKLSSCFVDFFARYKVQGIRFNGTRTLGENLADSAGLKYAYKAFKAVQRDDDSTLPDLELSPDKLFFLGFSQLWCRLLSPEMEKNYLLSYPHTLPRYRVLGTLSNNREFSKAFNCKGNSGINPVIKCEVW